ncbi:MAG: thioredoxin fold domain-containing protein [Candidatus Eisenbacteria bacterium]|nr:thioredoxin fold domain-containing protein [Candidatus Latescibacterota bacterium]MBD3303302.1 thioredoxin fold domain-containing protein [Candidatus Eisenbacteria bacterium]
MKQRDRNEGSEEPTRIEASSRSREPLPRLVDLGADQCVPCKKMAPILRELAEEYRGRLIVEFIDVWKNPEAAEPYGIRVIPTQIFYDASGVERFRHEGFLAKEAILAKWRDLGVPLGPPPSTGAM